MKKNYIASFFVLALTLFVSFSMCSQSLIVANDDFVTVTNPTIAPPGMSPVTFNDQINGAPINLNQVDITLLNSPTPLITLDLEGGIVVNSQTPNGVYVLLYQVCIRTDPNNCATAFVTVTVDFCRTPMPLIDAVIQPTCEVQTGTVTLSGLPTIGTWTITLVRLNSGTTTILTGLGETFSIPNLAPGSYTLSVYQEDASLANCFGSINVTFNIDNQFMVEAGPTKTYVDFNNDGYTNVGDVVNYAFTVYNNSCTDFTDISIASSDYTILGGPISLAPQTMDSTSLTATYVITQDDINNGEVLTSYTLSGLQNGVPIDNDNAAIDIFGLNISDGIKLTAFLDSNSNGIKDNNEGYFTNGEYNYDINNSEGINHIASADGSLFLYESNPLNTYNLSFTVNGDYAANYVVSPPSYSNITVPYGSGITEFAFAVTVTPFADLAISLYNYAAPPRPGFTYQNIIHYTNHGNQTIAAGTVTFVKDSLLSITNISAAGTVISDNGFTLDFFNLAPSETRHIIVSMQVPTIPTVTLGQQLVNSTSITASENELNIANNTSSLTQTIVGSYDPNDKSESHGGQVFSADDYLTYTIRFENTGTANAINVKVDDLLDAKLDENTVRTLNASHPFVLKRINNALTWRFDGIDLPPSVENDDITGHGYVVFQVKPKSGFAIGDVIPNTAEIYFDFNPAIVTNTCTTEFAPLLGISAFENNSFEYYPNPTSGLLTFNFKNASIKIERIEVLDILGNSLISKIPDYNSTTLELSALSNGMYLVKINANGQEKTIKIIKQ